MRKKEFFSSFYKGIITPDDPRYWEKAKVESMRKYLDLLRKQL
jgi:hypothetical protein